MLSLSEIDTRRRHDSLNVAYSVGGNMSESDVFEEMLEEYLESLRYRELTEEAIIKIGFDWRYKRIES